MKITVKNGRGREGCPYIKPPEYIESGIGYIDEPNLEIFIESTQDYNILVEAFNREHSEYLAPGLEDTPEGETVECELVWQIEHTKGWTLLREEEVDMYITSNAKTRQIWVLSQGGGEKEKQPDRFYIMDSGKPFLAFESEFHIGDRQDEEVTIVIRSGYSSIEPTEKYTQVILNLLNNGSI